MKKPEITPTTGAEPAAEHAPDANPARPTEAEPPAPLVEGRDYVLDEQGRFVLTAAYLRERGECCGSGCRNCPYG